MMLEDQYCMEICKGKCCYTRLGMKCKHLGVDARCMIHDLWKDNWCHYEENEIKTAPIMILIKNNLLRKDIVDQCCYAHPELLDK